jgi:hypothetical protein
MKVNPHTVTQHAHTHNTTINTHTHTHKQHNPLSELVERFEQTERMKINHHTQTTHTHTHTTQHTTHKQTTQHIFRACGKDNKRSKFIIHCGLGPGWRSDRITHNAALRTLSAHTLTAGITTSSPACAHTIM